MSARIGFLGRSVGCCAAVGDAGWRCNIGRDVRQTIAAVQRGADAGCALEAAAGGGRGGGGGGGAAQQQSHHALLPTAVAHTGVTQTNIGRSSNRESVLFLRRNTPLTGALDNFFDM